MESKSKICGVYPDIWILIASLLERKDLSRLCRITKETHDLLLPLLYKNVVLHPEKDTKTLEMILKRPEIADSIRSLRFYMPSLHLYQRREQDLNITSLLHQAIHSMKNLKSLHGNRSFFTCKEQQRTFFEAIGKRENPLEEFTFTDGLSLELFPSKKVALPGLKKIVWDCDINDRA